MYGIAPLPPCSNARRGRWQPPPPPPRMSATEGCGIKKMKAHNRKMVPKLKWGLVRTVKPLHLSKCVEHCVLPRGGCVVNPNKQNPKSVLIIYPAALSRSGHMSNFVSGVRLSAAYTNGSDPEATLTNCNVCPGRVQRRAHSPASFLRFRARSYASAIIAIIAFAGFG